MHTDLNMSIIRRDREREIRALLKEYEVRQALSARASTSMWPPRWIAAGISALVRLGEEWKRLTARSRRAEASI